MLRRRSGPDVAARTHVSACKPDARHVWRGARRRSRDDDRRLTHPLALALNRSDRKVS